MIKDIWINLPVKDIQRSKEFYTAIGFKSNEKHNSPDSLSFLIGDKNIVLMLFPEKVFQSFTINPVSDAVKGTEVLLSLGASSREEVDELQRNAEASGGTVFSPAAEVMGWMYGCGVADPDGHRWNALYMDMSKMKSQR